VVASIGLDGAPEQRTMILRKVDVASRTLRFFTDTRSAKVAEWQRHAHVSVLAYSASDKLQLRLAGKVRCETDTALADNCWANLRDTARAGYAQGDTPGGVLENPDSHLPILETARGNFCLIHVDVDCIDWVFLSPQGNRRAQFSWPHGNLQAQWLAP
jgi:pyridoxamine 5'-phosphate oxidase